MSELADNLGALLHTVEGRLAAPEERLSASETLLLAELIRRPARPSYLADRLRLSRPRITQLLRRMAERDLVRSGQQAGDRRGKVFTLTADGQLAAERAERRVKDLERTVRFALGRAGSALFSEQLRDLERRLAD